MGNDNMREEFEAWATENGMGLHLDRSESGLYVSPVTQKFLGCWVASQAKQAAEVKSLKGSCRAMGKDMAKVIRERNSARAKAEKLGAEVETVRKELGARHPFRLSKDGPEIGYTGCVICGQFTDHQGLPCPNMRAFAMSKEAGQ